MTLVMGEDYVTVAEAAVLVGVSTSTIWRWIDRGILPAYRIGPRKVRLRRGDLAGIITPARAQATPTRDSLESISRLGPLTPKERAQMLAAIEASKRSHTEQLARRGGQPYPSSTEIIHEMREERLRQLP